MFFVLLFVLSIKKDGHKVSIIVGDALHREHAQVEGIQLVAAESAPRRENMFHHFLVEFMRLRTSVQEVGGGGEAMTKGVNLL